MMYKIGKLREKKGFTLVELIVVIAIIAILTAVLVPLVNNWSQQAAYTMLNDNAQTVSNVINEAISKFVAGGRPLVSHVDTITGKKTPEGGFVVTVGDVEGRASDTVSSTDAAEKKIAVEIANMLDATLNDPSVFFAAMSSGAVGGVIYSTSKSELPTAEQINAVKRVGDGNGYEIDGYGSVGVTGKFKAESET